MLKDFLYYLLRKEADGMAVIYATLIVKGKKTYAQVPDKIKPQVKQILIDLECEDLITEEE
jgi:hypothetical protein